MGDRHTVKKSLEGSKITITGNSGELLRAASTYGCPDASTMATNLVTGLLSESADGLGKRTSWVPDWVGRFAGHVASWTKLGRELQSAAKTSAAAKRDHMAVLRLLDTLRSGTISPTGEYSSEYVPGAWDDRWRKREIHQLGAATLTLALGGQTVTVSAARGEETSVLASTDQSPVPVLNETDQLAIGWARSTVEFLAETALRFGPGNLGVSFAINGPAMGLPEPQSPTTIIEVGQAAGASRA